MIATFVIIAAVMVVTALVWVIVPLLRGAKGDAVAREASNIAVLRDQLRELDADVGNGIISRERYEQAKLELQQRVLDESKPASAGPPGVPSAAGAWTAAILGGTLPIAAIALYLVLGSFNAFAPQTKSAAADHDLSPQKVDEMIKKLVARLEQDPNNAQGWAILARTYYAMDRMQQATAAYARAAALDPDNAGLLADYADALAATQKSLEGKPMELVERALKVDPTQWKALALAGTAAFDRRDFKLAIDYWERLRTGLPPESNLAKSIAGSIAEARQLGGIKATPVPVSPPSAQATPSASPPSAAMTADAATRASSATVAGSITLSPSLAGKAAPTDTVFVFARAVEGPKMPLAIMRKQVKDLPATFALDDSMAMAPQMKISNFPEVVVGARISRSGTATPQSGDLEGFSKPVKVGSNGVAVVIDTPRP